MVTFIKGSKIFIVMTTTQWLYMDTLKGAEQIEAHLEEAGIPFTSFMDQRTLSNFLVDNKNQLQNYGIIIESNINTQSTIKVHPKWIGREAVHKLTQPHAAGLTYIKEVILCKRNGEYVWGNTLPPIAILSASTETPNTPQSILETKLAEIQTEWATHHKTTPWDAKIHFSTKENYFKNPKAFIKKIQEYSR